MKKKWKEVPEDKDTTISQKETLIKKMTEEIKSSTIKLKELKDEIKGIEKIILDKHKKKEDEICEQVKKAEKVKVEANEAIMSQHNGLAQLNDEKNKFEEFKKDELKAIEVEKGKALSKIKESIIHKERSDQAINLFKAEQVDINEARVNLIKRSKADAIAKKDLDALNEAVNRELEENTTTLKKITKQLELVDVRLNEVTVRTDSAVQKEEEIVVREEGLKKREAVLAEKETLFNEEKSKSEDQAIEMIVKRKKNEVESARLSKIRSDLINREAKLSSRENLFKTKIGGK